MKLGLNDGIFPFWECDAIESRTPGYKSVRIALGTYLYGLSSK